MLGNSHRLLLPSYWWKKIFGAVVDKLDEKVDASNLKTIGGESLIGEGDITGFPIVHSKEELDALDVPLGGVASLVTGGPIVSSFEGCYMPSAEEMGSEEIFLDVFPKLTRVEKLNFHMPEDGSVPTLLCLLVDKRLNFKCVLTMSEEDGTEMIAVQWGGNSLENMVYLYFKDINDSINFTNYIPQRLNDELSSRDVRLVYFANKNGVIEDPEEQAETQKVFSQFFSREELIPYNSTPYIKSEGWDRISKDYIVSSIEELEKLNLPVGTIVSVAKEGKGKVNPYELFTFDLDASDEDVVNNLDKYTRIIRIESFAPTPSETNILNIGILAEMEIGDTVATSTISLSFDKGQLVAVLNDDRVVTQDELNDILKSGNFRLMLLNKRQEVADFVTNYTAFYGEDTIADTYIKGDTWEKLAKEGEEGAIFRELYIPSLEEPLTEAQKAYNKETIELYKEGKAIACISDNDTKFIATQLVFERGFPVLFFDSLDRIIIYLLDEKGDVADVDEFIKFEDANNKVTTISSASTDKEYPSAKAVYDAIQQSGGEAGPQGPQGEQGVQGEKGEDGVGITSVVQTTTSSADGGSNVVTVTLSDGKTSTFTVKNGSKGTQGEKGADGAKGDKGDKGDTGATGPQGNSGYTGAADELEVVNNLTQGGATAALSAEMGKTLDGKLTELSAEVADSVSALKRDTQLQFDGGVLEESITDFADKGKFLYDKITLDSAQYNITKYIIIDAATEIVLTNLWATDVVVAYAIYDVKKNLLSSNPTPSATGLQNYTLTSADLPDGAMYLRATQNTLHEASVRVISDYKGVKNEIAELKSGGGQLSSSAYIALPVPELAMVNIISKTLPETKTADIEAVMEFNDMQGNIIKKNIIINAQGNSTLGHAKKNFGVDIVDSKYDESHSLKFGNWVAQDSFHWKAYMLDQTRVKAMAAYDFYESILLTRGMRKDRSWKRLQLPTDIPTASGSVTGEYLAMDSGAKCHPVGFPFILFHNGSFYGIYCWQLKKHRDNYHQKKSKAEHIHLDGNISNTLLWNANGVIDWAKWSGLVDESAESPNMDGIEIRNPKNLILVDGSKYDGDDNRGELISTTSAKYDASNEDMVMTAKVRQSLELFSRNVYNLQQMSKGAEKKAEIAKVFDVESIIDFIIFGQITGNVDGYKKNWQWNTYDGVKWAVNAYDLDAVWGWGGSSYYEPSATFIGTYAPPVAMVVENYLDEIKARYAELRDKGVITTEQVLKPLYNYVRIIGADYYEQEYAKWPFGNADNLWRFEEWVAEAIRLTDILMDYNL